jgi:hypothetical protein
MRQRLQDSDVVLLACLQVWLFWRYRYLGMEYVRWLLNLSCPGSVSVRLGSSTFFSALEVTQAVYIIGGLFGWARLPMFGPYALVLDRLSCLHSRKGFLGVT